MWFRVLYNHQSWINKQCLTFNIQRKDKSITIAQVLNFYGKKEKPKKKYIHGLVAGFGSFSGPVSDCLDGVAAGRMKVAVKVSGWLAAAGSVVKVLKDDWRKVRKWRGEAEKTQNQRGIYFLVYLGHCPVIW